MLIDVGTNIKMNYALEDVARTLKEARAHKGLSQRELAARSGVRQYQISKFENGAQDLRVSSLVELARALDLELSLVPRKSLSAVNSIIRSSWPSHEAANFKEAEWTRWLDAVNELVNNNPRKRKEYAQIVNLSRMLAHFPISTSDYNDLRKVYRKLISHKDGAKKDELARETVAYLQNLRNRLAHEPFDADRQTVKPAYSLDEDDDD